MTNNTFKFSLLLFCLTFTIPDVYSQWRYPNADNIKNDVIIKYDVVYENELSEEQKQSPRFINDIVVIFNSKKIKEKFFLNTIDQEVFHLYDLSKKKLYNGIKFKNNKWAFISNILEPTKKVTLLDDEEAKILGFPCQVSTAEVNGITRKIYTTKKFGLRFVKSFKTEGFLLKYTLTDDILGPYTVTAKEIFYSKLPETTYSLDGYHIQTMEQQRKELSLLPAKQEKGLKNIGKTSHNFSAKSMKGKKIKSKDLIGKVVVLNFWFINCPPCLKEIPLLNDLKKKYKDKNVEFIAVALDSESKIYNFLKHTPFNYNQITDGKWMATKFDISRYPTNLIIDKKGIVQLFKTSFRKDITEIMSAKIDELLETN